jgi:hypothetical protein
VAGSRKPEPSRKRRSWEHLSRKGALSRDKPSSLTRGRWKRFWFLTASGLPESRGARQGASEVVLPTPSSADNAESGWRRQRRRPRSRPPRGGASGVCATIEAGDAPSSAYPTGVELPQGGSAPLGRTRPRSRKHPAVVRSESCELGNRTIHGCSCRESVAEVGKKHLPNAVEASREANQDDAR